MHDLDAGAVGDADGHDDFGAFGDGGEVRRVDAAVARRDVVALARYCTFIAFGIQRWVVGTVASISMPIAISAALHDAMACTVCRWLCTKNQLGTSTSARPGSIRLTWGSTEAKYGTRAIAATENSRLPPGRSDNCFQMR